MNCLSLGHSAVTWCLISLQQIPEQEVGLRHNTSLSFSHWCRQQADVVLIMSLILKEFCVSSSFKTCWILFILRRVETIFNEMIECFSLEETGASWQNNVCLLAERNLIQIWWLYFSHLIKLFLLRVKWLNSDFSDQFIDCLCTMTRY